MNKSQLIKFMEELKEEKRKKKVAIMKVILIEVVLLYLFISLTGSGCMSNSFEWWSIGYAFTTAILIVTAVILPFYLYWRWVEKC